MPGRRKKRRKMIKSFRLILAMKRKLFVVFLLAIAAMVFLVGRLVYINVTSGTRYEKIVLSQQGYASETIPFRRGDILDRKGTVLATSTDVYNVILDFSVMTAEKRGKMVYLEPTLMAIGACFDVDITELKEYVLSNKDRQYYVLAKRVEPEKVDEFKALQTPPEKQEGQAQNTGDDTYKYIRGVWFEKEYIRNYPYDTLASSLIGFTTSGNEGIGGLEGYYNDTLNGTDGREYGYLNQDTNYEKSIREAANGNTIVSTIDANIQSIIQDKLHDYAEEYSSNENLTDAAAHVGVLVEDPNTGEILGMANYPTFSLNDPWDLSAFFTEEELNAMSDEDRLDTLNHLWQNFCVSSTYEPGSTAKPMTIAAGLDSGKLDEDDTFDCTGALLVGTSNIHCMNNKAHGTETLADALAESCNVSLMQIGFQIGAEEFTKYQQIFNIGLRTNIDLPGEARTDTLIYTLDNMSDINLAVNAFGQSFNLTMVEMISAYCSIVNGGNYYLPHVVSRIVDENGNTVENIEPTLLRRTISESTSDTMTDLLQAVLQEGGTGTTAKLEGYSMCGKTGTAEKLPRGNGNYVVSFIGSVPAKNPEVVIYVVVDEPNVEEQYHSVYAQEIAKAILEEVLPYMNIEKDEAVESDDDAAAGEDGEAVTDGEADDAEDGETDETGEDTAEEPGEIETTDDGE